MKVRKVSVGKRLSLLPVIALSLPLASLHAKELARVNESVITDKDLVMALGAFNEGQRSHFLKDATSRHQVLLDLIDRKVLALEGEKLKLDQDPEFKAAMVQYRQQLLMGLVLEKKFASQLTPSAVKQYYDKNKIRFNEDQVHVQHILLEDEEKANSLLKEAQSPDADFQQLAEKYSKDPSAKNNRGDLGFIGRNRFSQDFTEAAFSTSVGRVVGPVKTLFGYHLIKVVDKKLGKQLAFDEVELQAREMLRQEIAANYVAHLRSQYKIKVDQAALEK